jgi:hypothetical protein
MRKLNLTLTDEEGIVLDNMIIHVHPKETPDNVILDDCEESIWEGDTTTVNIKTEGGLDNKGRLE